MSTARPVSTPYGDGRLVVHRAPRGRFATLLLSHGAGNGVEARDLAALAADLPRQGITVALFEQPWRVAGRRIATAPPTLDVGIEAAVRLLRPPAPFVVGGRSAGARSAARCAAGLGAAGCLALAFPLHPPGRPESSRLAELEAPAAHGVPTLVVQGERDPMGRPEEFPDGIELVVVPAADHGFKVPARGPLSQADALALVVEATLEWIVREVAGNP
ncbi:alpha/beta family hydrolase [Nocardioides cynanchi]|uniref:alpha/beta hydrolase family protein n=1 Tax=Nocardioides cynanchi TaxID=2558918 RepID=UPI001248AD94|nr:alpha/beta family hydrolase [Nocardioides cynanchi]